MQKRTGITLAAVALMGIVSIGSAMAQSAIAVPEKLKSAGVLRVAGDASFPPFFYLDQKGEYQGFDADLARAVGEVLKVKVNFTNTKTEGLLTGIMANRFDVGMSGLIDRPVREESFDFVNYYRGGSSLLVKGGNPQKITPATICGNDIAAGKGTAADVSNIPALAKECEAAGKPPVKSVPFPDYNAAVLAVESGRVPAAMTLNAINAWIAAHSEGKVMDAGVVPGTFLIGVAVQKGNTELVNALYAAIDTLMKNGVYAKLLQKYNVANNPLDKPRINLPK